MVVAPGNEGFDTLARQGLGHIVQPPVVFIHAIAAAAAAAVTAARIGRRQGARRTSCHGGKRGREGGCVSEEIWVLLHLFGGGNVGREAGHGRGAQSRDGGRRRRRDSRGHSGAGLDGLVGGAGTVNVHDAQSSGPEFLGG